MVVDMARTHTSLKPCKYNSQLKGVRGSTGFNFGAENEKLGAVHVGGISLGHKDGKIGLKSALNSA